MLALGKLAPGARGPRMQTPEISPRVVMKPRPNGALFRNSGVQMH